VNIRDLQYLIAVHDLNNFSKAAERCFVSQPTLSGQLKKLEEELDVALIERSTRQVLFTPVGEKIVAQARDVVHTVNRIKSIAKETDDPMVGEFHIGLIPTIGPFLLPIIMPELAKAYPEASLFLYELQTEKLLDKLLKGELDAAILAKLDWNHPLQEIPLYTEPMNLAVAAQDDLSKNQEAVSINVLENQPVLMLEDGHCLRDQAMGVCFSAGAKEDGRFQATSMDTLLHMVATGAGMTLIPELATRNKVDGVRFLSFTDPTPSREVIMIIRKQSTRVKALTNIADVIKTSV